MHSCLELALSSVPEGGGHALKSGHGSNARQVLLLAHLIHEMRSNSVISDLTMKKFVSM